MKLLYRFQVKRYSTIKFPIKNFYYSEMGFLTPT